MDKVVDRVVEVLREVYIDKVVQRRIEVLWLSCVVVASVLRVESCLPATTLSSVVLLPGSLVALPVARCR